MRSVEAAFDAGVVDVADAVGVGGDKASAGPEDDVATRGADHRVVRTLWIDAVGDEADAAAGFGAGAVALFLPLVDVAARCVLTATRFGGGVGVAGDERRGGAEDDD